MRLLPRARVESYDPAVTRRHSPETCPTNVRFGVHRVVATLLLGVALAGPSTAGAQAPRADEAERERGFVEALRREDPAEAERFVALNDARTQAVNELRRVEAQYNAAGPELRSAFSGSLRRAQHTYAEASLALLDFFDARERRAVARYQEEIRRVQKAIEDSQRTRAELQKLLTP